MKEVFETRSYISLISGFWLLVIMSLDNPAGMDIIDAVIVYLIK